MSNTSKDRNISYKKKIEIYNDLLPMIAFGINHSIQKKYITGLKKLFSAKEKEIDAKDESIE